MRSLDGYDNVAVFFNDSGKVVPYEHEYKRPTPGQRQAKVRSPEVIVSLTLVCVADFRPVDSSRERKENENRQGEL